MGVIEQGVFDAHFQPCASVYKAAVQSISSSSFTTATFDTERFDTDTIHDTVTNNSRLTCKTAGKYQITGFVQWPANATGFRQSRIVINGASNVAIMSTNGNAGHGSEQTPTRLWDMAVNDYAELTVFQDSGGALNLTAEFMMVRVG